MAAGSFLWTANTFGAREARLLQRAKRLCDRLVVLLPDENGGELSQILRACRFVDEVALSPTDLPESASLVFTDGEAPFPSLPFPAAKIVPLQDGGDNI